MYTNNQVQSMISHNNKHCLLCQFLNENITLQWLIVHNQLIWQINNNMLSLHTNVLHFASKTLYKYVINTEADSSSALFDHLVLIFNNK